ncbi:MAG: SprB repeat-containing protein [Cyclobacteriaceae bacterium]
MIKSKIFYLTLISVGYLISCSSEKESDLLEMEFDCALSDLALTLDNVSKPGCSTSGSIAVVGAGGDGVFEYSLGEKVQSSGVFEGLQAGQFEIKIEDGNGCISTLMVDLEAAIGSISAQTEMTVANCSAADGQLVVNVSGGTGVYTYSIDGAAEVSSNTFSELTAGDYTIVVKDDTGCTTQVDANVGVDNGDISQSISATVSGCGTSLATISVDATGGNGTYSYSLDKSDFVSTGEFQDVSAGMHSVTLKDGNGCETVDEIQVLSGVSLKDDVATIISTNCATNSGCHATGASGSRPVLETAQQIIDKADRIMIRTEAKTMPPSGGSLTNAQIATIACWVEDGTLNN